MTRKTVTPSNRAVFLDRDGVINAIVERDGKPASPRSLAEFQIDPEARTVLQALKAEGFHLFVVTNQPDIRRGLMDEAVLQSMSDLLMETLPIDEVSACLHDDRDACACRKPKPGMLLDLAERWAIDLDRSFLVGDQDRDVLCGLRAGCTTVLLDRSYNTGANAHHVVPSLAAAAALVLERAELENA
ncbi:MAG TPA: HAD-IIIA family hydrolase [Stellaceae bacterium]|nr:HAD-IIIA family hydrolase [Stellaceae bacterium]